MTSYGSSGSSVDINKLGLQIDGWADLIEGGAAKADDAMESLENMVRSRDWPRTRHGPFYINPTGSRKQRKFMLIEISNGATIAAYIGAFGNDLFAKWDLYVRPILNKQVFQVAAVVIAVLSVFGGTYRQFGEVRFSLGRYFAVFIGLAILAAIILTLIGNYVYSNPLHFFFKQLDEFDIDDIAALSLATHQTVLTALDEVGFSIETLRVKKEFRPGSRERVI